MVVVTDMRNQHVNVSRRKPNARRGYCQRSHYQKRCGQVLAAGKRGAASFIFPNGKPEPDESAIDATMREASEE